jgi:replicative DNA helicase
MIANHAAEQVVLGTLLAEPSAGFVANSLTVDEFTVPLHRLLFEAIEARVQEGQAPSPAILAPQFVGDKIEGMPAPQYMLQLVRNAVTLDDLSHYVRSLREYSGRREMVGIAEEMGKTAKSLSAQILPFNEGVVASLGQISAGMKHGRQSSFMLADAAQQTVDRLRSGKKPNLIDTGLADLNKDIGGWTRGELTILAGRPSMGKTTVALSSLRQAARRGVTSLFFSMEMSRQALSDRMLSDAVFNSQTPIHYTNIIRGKVNQWDIDRLQEAQQSMVGLPMRIDDQSRLTVTDIGIRIRRYQDELERLGKRLDVVCLDHLGFIRASDRYAGQRVNEVGEISAAMKEMAKELDVAVMLLCQLSREVERRDDKRPQLADLRDSGNLEQDADTVIFTFRKAYYLARTQFDNISEENDRIAELEVMERIIELLGLKTRNGPIFTRRLFVDMGSNAIRDLAA